MAALTGITKSAVPPSRGGGTHPTYAAALRGSAAARPISPPAPAPTSPRVPGRAPTTLGASTSAAPATAAATAMAPPAPEGSGVGARTGRQGRGRGAGRGGLGRDKVGSGAPGRQSTTAAAAGTSGGAVQQQQQQRQQQQCQQPGALPQLWQQHQLRNHQPSSLAAPAAEPTDTFMAEQESPPAPFPADGWMGALHQHLDNNLDCPAELTDSILAAFSGLPPSAFNGALAEVVPDSPSSLTPAMLEWVSQQLPGGHHGSYGEQLSEPQSE